MASAKTTTSKTARRHHAKAHISDRRSIAAQADKIAQAANRLARMMRDLHGPACGEWAAHIDHQHGFVLVRLIPRKRVGKGGEA